MSPISPFRLSPPTHRPQLDPQWAGPVCAIVGDLHGDLEVLDQIDREAPPGLPILQVGDLGWGDGNRSSFIRAGRKLRREVYWIRGNWDARLAGRSAEGSRWLQPKRVVEGFWAVPDGAVLDVGAWRIGCWGGAAHAHRMFRHLNGRPSGPDAMNAAEQAASLAWPAVDLLLAHTPPADWIEQVWARLHPQRDVVRDVVAQHVQALREAQAKAASAAVGAASCANAAAVSSSIPVVAGHLHRPCWDVDAQVRVLGEREWIWGPRPGEPRIEWLMQQAPRHGA